MKRYVAGFVFSLDRKRVLLIKKTKPTWQAGRYNAIGGKVERGETGVEAMAREFEEEAGLFGLIWQQYCVLTSSTAMCAEDGSGGWCVEFYRAFSDAAMRHFTSRTEEIVIDFDLRNLPPECLPNLAWLIPMALSDDPATFDVREQREAA